MLLLALLAACRHDSAPTRAAAPAALPHPVPDLHPVPDPDPGARTAPDPHPHPDPGAQPPLQPDPDPAAAGVLHVTGKRDTLSIEETWKNGQLEGPRRIYRLKLLVLEESYRDGLLDGDWIAYLTSGKPRAKGRYRQGKRDGTWATWHSNGKPCQSQGDYADGGVHFDRSGRKTKAPTGGLKNGWWISYDARP